MKYFYFGNQNDHAGKKLSHNSEKKEKENKSSRELVIDDNTIYEIDEKCLKCQKNNKA